MIVQHTLWKSFWYYQLMFSIQNKLKKTNTFFDSGVPSFSFPAEENSPSYIKRCWILFLDVVTVER